MLQAVCGILSLLCEGPCGLCLLGWGDVANGWGRELHRLDVQAVVAAFVEHPASEPALLLGHPALDCAAPYSLFSTCCSTTAMFGASALYHRPTWQPQARAFFRRLDHAAIFLLIAGEQPI